MASGMTRAANAGNAACTSVFASYSLSLLYLGHEVSHELGIGGTGASWPIVLPFFDGKVPAGFLNPAEDHLETPLDLTEYLIENKAATFMMRVDGDSMIEAGILDGHLLVVDRAAKPVNG